MVNNKRNFQADLLHELKWFTHCKFKNNDRNHFCNQKELSKNLKMSLRDVGKNLAIMTQKDLLEHSKYLYKARMTDRFQPIDQRRYDDEDMFHTIEIAVYTHLKIVRRVALVMKDRPSTHSIKMIPLTQEQRVNMLSRSYTGKIDKVGKKALITFVDEVNDVFSYLDSLSYASLDDTITPNSKTEKRIQGLRKFVLDEITDVINYTISHLPARQASAIKQDILMRIPTYYMLTQLRKQSKVMI